MDVPGLTLPGPPRLRLAAAAMAALTLAYVGALVWLDTRNAVFVQLPAVFGLLPALAACCLASFALRHARWHLLLARSGHRLPFATGFACYLSGFAFTATPGKVGELVRIRYHARHGVPPARVFAAFVFERAQDVVAVTLIALAAVRDPQLLATMGVFLAVVLGAVFVFAARPRLATRASASVRRAGWPRAARVLSVVARGLAGTRAWWNARDLAVSMALGLVAWLLPAVAFAWLVGQLGAVVPFADALAIYPAAMLVGAASFLPGGIGPTEAVIVLMLSRLGVALGVGALAAVAMRLASLWFSVLVGFLAMAWLEHRG